jgi:hypothetical protein
LKTKKIIKYNIFYIDQRFLRILLRSRRGGVLGQGLSGDNSGPYQLEQAYITFLENRWELAVLQENSQRHKVKMSRLICTTLIILIFTFDL